MKLSFINALTREAEKNQRIVMLTGDLGFQIFDDFAFRFGPRFINVGVAEAQLVLAAAGLALEGWLPFTYSIASFATARCYEQIKISVAYPMLPVVIVGTGGGYAYAHSGPTHHAGDDLALMCGLPGMTVVAPGDVNEIEALVPQLIQLRSPAYFRFGRGKEPEYKVESPVVLGRARLLADGEDVAILSTGVTAWEAWSALPLLAAKDIHPLTYQFHTLKPLDTEALEYIVGKVRFIVTTEEHAATGGLSYAVARWLATRECGPRLIPLCVADEFVLGSPHQNEIRSHYGFDAKGIAETVENLLDKS